MPLPGEGVSVVKGGLCREADTNERPRSLRRRFINARMRIVPLSESYLSGKPHLRIHKTKPLQCVGRPNVFSPLGHTARHGTATHEADSPFQVAGGREADIHRRPRAIA